MEVAPGQVETEFSVVRFGGDRSAAAKVYEGCEPLTPEDVAEVIVFQASRRHNVVVAVYCCSLAIRYGDSRLHGLLKA